MIADISIQLANLNRSNSAASSSLPNQQPDSQSENGKILPAKPVTVATPANNNRQQVDSVELKKVTDALNKFMQSHHRGLLFALDDDTGRTIIKVINKDTQEVVRQFPPEEILSISRMITESLAEAEIANTGLLLEEQS